MINKEIQQHIKRELTESFKVFYSSLYQHENYEKVNNDMKAYIEDISELMEISDDVDLKVKFVCYLNNGDVKHTKYIPIQLFAKNGLDIIAGVERIEAQVKVVVRKNNCVLESTDNNPFFKSEVFVLEENVNNSISKLQRDSIVKKEGNGVLVSLQDLQDGSGNKIRFDDNKTLEL